MSVKIWTEVEKCLSKFGQRLVRVCQNLVGVWRESVKIWPEVAICLSELNWRLMSVCYNLAGG